MAHPAENTLKRMRSNRLSFKMHTQNLLQVPGIIAISRDQNGTFLEIWPQNTKFVRSLQPFMYVVEFFFFCTVLVYT